MSDISRRTFIKGTGAALLTSGVFSSHSTRAAEFSYKFANELPENHPVNQWAAKAAAKILEETSGSVEIKIFPNSLLGSQTDMLSQVRSGAIDFVPVSGIILSTLVPVSSIHGLGFIFPNYASVWTALDGDLGKHVRAQIEKAGLFAFSKIWDTGYRQITTSTRPINVPDDLKNFKIRVPVSPLWTSMFKALGASPVSINFGEVYSSLQTKIVDGQETALSLVQSNKFYEVQKYCSLTNHMWDGPWLVANRRSWDRLPEKTRAIVETNFNSAAVSERAESEKLNVSTRAELTKLGLVFNEPKREFFRDTLRKAGFYGEWKAKYGAEAWALLEKTTGKLG
jgi:tripartite ATP-independent transporter DctP family solute receptor